MGKKILKKISVVLIVMTLFLTNIVRSNAASYVATMRLFSSVVATGHSWLLITNTSSSTLTVGKYSLPAGQNVYVGLWGNMQWDGIWYNAEGYQKSKGELSRHNSIEMKLTSANINTISSIINSYYSTWNVLNNCSSFAVKCWNAVSTIDLSAGTPNLPTHLGQSIPSVFPDDYDVNYLMPEKTQYQTYYWNGSKLVQEAPYQTGSSSFSHDDLELLSKKCDLELQ